VQSTVCVRSWRGVQRCTLSGWDNVPSSSLQDVGLPGHEPYLDTHGFIAQLLDEPIHSAIAWSILNVPSVPWWGRRLTKAWAGGSLPSSKQSFAALRSKLSANGAILEFDVLHAFVTIATSTRSSASRPNDGWRPQQPAGAPENWSSVSSAISINRAPGARHVQCATINAGHSKSEFKLKSDTQLQFFFSIRLKGSSRRWKARRWPSWWGSISQRQALAIESGRPTPAQKHRSARVYWKRRNSGEHAARNDSLLISWTAIISPWLPWPKQCWPAISHASRWTTISASCEVNWKQLQLVLLQERSAERPTLTERFPATENSLIWPEPHEWRLATAFQLQHGIVQQRYSGQRLKEILSGPS